MANAEKKSFSLGDALADALGNVPKSGTNQNGLEQIEYLDLTALDADANNFYSLDGLDELVANIELIGLQQPLRVRPNPDMPGRYFIVSGHRRRAALLKLAEEGQERFAMVPCIVEQPAGSAALQELRLIYANSDTRKMSSADLSKQAERVEALLYQLKEEGYDFPGRMRDHVAEACKVSKTKLATLKVIREKLVPELLELWGGGDLVESSALVLARESAEVQRAVVTLSGKGGVVGRPEWWIDNKIRSAHSILNRSCEALGGTCGHTDALLRQFAANPYSSWCDTRCCLDCPALTKCNNHCAAANAHAEAKEAERAAAEKQREDDEKQREDERKAEHEREAARIRQAWINAGNAAKAKGLSTTEAMAALGFDGDLDEDDLADIEALFAGTAETDWHDEGPWTYWDAADALAAADALGCSVDYLLGRTEEMAAVPKAASEPSPGEYKPLAEGSMPKEGQRVILAGIVDGEALYSERVWRGQPLNAIEADTYTLWIPTPLARFEGETIAEAGK